MEPIETEQNQILEETDVETMVKHLNSENSKIKKLHQEKVIIHPIVSQL